MGLFLCQPQSSEIVPGFVADSAEATGLKWAAPAGANWSLLNAGGTALTGAQTITVSGISSKDKIMIIVDDAICGAEANLFFTLNTDTGSNYNYFGQRNQYASTYAAGNFFGVGSTSQATGFLFAKQSTNGSAPVSGYCLLSGCNASGVKVAQIVGGAEANGGNAQRHFTMGGIYTGSSTISSISIYNDTQNFSSGTVFVYTSA